MLRRLWRVHCQIWPFLSFPAPFQAAISFLFEVLAPPRAAPPKAALPTSTFQANSSTIILPPAGAYPDTQSCSILLHQHHHPNQGQQYNVRGLGCRRKILFMKQYSALHWLGHSLSGNGYASSPVQFSHSSASYSWGALWSFPNALHSFPFQNISPSSSYSISHCLVPHVLPGVLVDSAGAFVRNSRECSSWEGSFSPVLKDDSAREREKLMVL